MKASAARGKRHSIMTAYVMRMLGLEVWPHYPSALVVRCNNVFPYY